MVIEPMRFSGSGACALRGDGAGVGSGVAVAAGAGAAVVGGSVVGGSVVAAVVGADVVAVEAGASVAGASARPGSSSTELFPPHAATTSAPAPATRKVRRSIRHQFHARAVPACSRVVRVRAAALALPDARGDAEAAVGGAGEDDSRGVGREVTARPRRCARGDRVCTGGMTGASGSPSLQSARRADP